MEATPLFIISATPWWIHNMSFTCDKMSKIIRYSISPFCLVSLYLACSGKWIFVENA